MPSPPRPSVPVVPSIVKAVPSMPHIAHTIQARPALVPDIRQRSTFLQSFMILLDS